MDAPQLVGRNVETGGAITSYVFRFKDTKTGKGKKVVILPDAGASQAQIEDLAASAFERWLTEVREEEQKKSGKHAPSPEERKEVGKAIRDFREYAVRRRQSTNQKRYYKGLD
tara:strand:+ start:13664 stop:14002 length:339 start_codon:yes stop_codon:yes gene_type:complete